jgi:hypothetical protein
VSTQTVASRATETATTSALRGRASGSRAWAFAGVAAAVTGIVGIAASTAINAVYDSSIEGNAVQIADKLADQRPAMVIFHVAALVSALVLLVFSAGLKRRLDAQAPAGSLLPAVAAAGLGLVSVAGMMGTGLDTEFLFGTGDQSKMVPEAAVVYNHWVGTIPWVWVGAAVAAVALAIAALRHAAAPRWIGYVSLILGGLTLLVGLSPLQYLAGMTGPIWLLVVSLGFAFGDRTAR